MATFHHGSALAIGGGGYDRSEPGEPVDATVEASGGEPLGALLNAVAAGGVLEITDSHRYDAPATLTAVGPADTQVVLRSSNRTRPLLDRNGQLRLVMEPDTTVVIDGLVLEGAPLVIEESADAAPRNLILRHCTLVPGIRRTGAGDPELVGRASLFVLHPFASVTLDHCIVGPIVAVEDSEVTVVDSVVDASGRDEIAFCGRDRPPGAGLRLLSTADDRRTGDGLSPGGHLTLESCTVIGKIHALAWMCPTP